MVQVRKETPNKSFIASVFPVPKFVKMPAVGFDIYDGGVRYVELILSKGVVTLGKFGEAKLPQGAIVSGYIYKKDEVVRVLKKIKEANNFQFVNVSLPEEKAYLFRTEVPKAAKDDIRSAIEFKIEENVPIPASEVVFDFVPIDSVGPTSDHLDVIVSAIPAKTSYAYLGVIKEAGLIPLAFEVSAQAISRAVIPRHDKGTFLVIDFRENKTGLSVVSGGIVYFTATVPVGSGNLVTAIQKQFSVSAEKAKEIKNNALLKNDKDTSVFMSVMGSIAPLNDEIGKLLIYWQTRGEKEFKKIGQIDSVILSGRDSFMPGFAEYIGSVAKTNARMANVWQNAVDFNSYVPPLQYADSLDYASAIGLALIKYA